MKSCKKVKKRIKKFMLRYINGTKGAISLFLAILMVPFATIAGSLINAARINSAVAVFDEALCNASNSTLGTYDSFLRERFGLLAMGQNTASHGSDYTAQDLISETFTYYMEKNLGTLSNTYSSTDLNALGIYPLSDTDVLLSEILEYGKYTVPTKMVIDGLSIDDLIKSLTSSLNFVGNIFNTLSSGAGMVDKFKSCEEKLDALREKIDGWVKAKKEYDDAYADFSSAIQEYNTLIDDIKEEKAQKQTAVNNASTKVSNCKSNLSTEEKKHPEIVAELNNLRNEKDAYGRPIDNTQKINEFKEKYKSELEGYLKAEQDLNDANSDLESAKSALNGVDDKYKNKLTSKRSDVTSAKSTYITKIDAFASSTLSTGNAVVAAQNSITAAINSGVSLASNVATNVYDAQKRGVDKQIDEMKENKAAAKERGDNTAEYLWQDQIDEANQNKTNINNENKLVKSATSSVSTAVSTLNTFAAEAYQEKYSKLYSDLINLKTSVNNYVIKNDSTSKLESASSYYVSVTTPLTSDEVKKMQEDLASEIAGSSFFAVIKAIAGFIKSIFTLTTWYDPELAANINTGYYNDSIGGLPSTKDRSSGSSYSFEYEYELQDKQKSEYYKNLLGEYSNNSSAAGTATLMETIIDSIKKDVDTISDCCNDWHWYNVFSNLGKILTAVGDIISNVMTMARNLLEVVATAIGQKALLTGYIAYNIPNRTTYTGSALTGKSYSLPTATSSNNGYAFYGAETEYILNGSYSEVDNQSSVFNIIYLLRLFYNLICVATNSEVSTIAGEAGAATFGIGTIVVYILYFIVEPFVDTLILVNGGDVPIVKTKVYLTPSGVVDLVSAFFKLNLTDDQKNEAYKQVVEVAGAGFVDEQFAEDYASAVSAFGTSKSSKFSQAMTFNYTKQLILIMMLFVNSDTMLDRLADIIQMECSYDSVNRIDKYTFDLDQSYTYLRASGSFTTNEFIKISNDSSLNSTQRVVYRGY